MKHKSRCVSDFPFRDTQPLPLSQHLRQSNVDPENVPPRPPITQHEMSVAERLFIQSAQAAKKSSHIGSLRFDRLDFVDA
jgi:hypothetical protein